MFALSIGELLHKSLAEVLSLTELEARYWAAYLRLKKDGET